MLITCYYSCHLCGLKKIPVAVEERGPEEQILLFVDRVAIAMAASHKKASPYCRPSTLSDVMIPAEGRMGEPFKH